MAAAPAAGARFFVTGDRGLLETLPGLGLRALSPGDVGALHACEDWPWA